MFWRVAECIKIDGPNMLWEGNDAGSPNCQSNGQGLHVKQVVSKTNFSYIDTKD